MRHAVRGKPAVPSCCASWNGQPWPGSTWQPCLNGCPDLEQALLVLFHERSDQAVVRARRRRHPAFVEPVRALQLRRRHDAARPPTNALSTHACCALERRRERRRQGLPQASRRPGDAEALLVTEWAIDDPGKVSKHGGPAPSCAGLVPFGCIGPTTGSWCGRQQRSAGAMNLSTSLCSTPWYGPTRRFWKSANLYQWPASGCRHT